MTEVLPQTQVMEARKGNPVTSSTAPVVGNFRDGRPKAGSPAEARLPSRLSKPSITRAPFSFTQSNGESIDGRQEQQSPIDPLSHHILNRSNPHKNMSRSPPPSDGGSGTPEVGDSTTSARTSFEPSIVRTEASEGATKDKRNRVSFFGRFKKKELPVEVNDNESEAGDRRTEGMDADVFSQPIGFIPRFPVPPKYIKVRSHGKKEKEFDRLFLAQELKGKTGVEFAQSGGRLVKNGGFKSGDPRKDGNAIWAMEFSKDGRYLAVGGQDFSLRVWGVIATPDDRRTHEREEDAAGKEGNSVRLNAPVFKKQTLQEYGGHTASILDISWSKNNFLLSSSMDKTVRLWHVSRSECLCCFKHSDFVTSIQFHPRDDRFFLAGSLDSKLRLWSIPDKSVAFWVQVPDLITAVAFAPDGKTAIAGCLSGLCLFYETEGLKYQTQIHVRSAHGKNAKGSKITGLQAINYPPNDLNGDVKLLVTSNDSRVRVYNLRDKGLEIKLKGNENTCSQIHASFSEDAKYVICGSEDRKAYIWSTSQPEIDKGQRPVEMFEAHSAIVTTAIMAPVKTRQLLSASGDPLYDLCNPPPITLVSRNESHSSSTTPSLAEHRFPDTSAPPTPATPNIRRPSKPEESPAYLARAGHPGGNIIVTADYMGRIKVFRQDCAYAKRLRSNNHNDSNFGRKMLGRTASSATRSSKHSRRDSHLSSNNPPSSDRILSWRQSIGSFDHQNRSISPGKSIGQASLHSSTHNIHPSPRHGSHPLSEAATPSLAATSPPASPNPSPPNRNSDDPHKRDLNCAPNIEQNPLMLQGEQSYMFWNRSLYKAQADGVGSANHRATLGPGSERTSADGSSSLGSHLGVPLQREITAASPLSSEESLVGRRAAKGSGNGNGEGEEELKCRRCGGDSFKARERSGSVRMVCGRCGEIV